MVQSHVEKEFSTFQGSFYESQVLRFSLGNKNWSLKLLSQAAEHSPNICGLNWDDSVEWYPESRVVFLMISPAANQFSALLVSVHFWENSWPCGSGESDAIMKHWMPWRDHMFFVQMRQKLRLKTTRKKQVSRLFSQNLFISSFVLLCFFFLFLFLWFLTVSTVVYIRCFVKRKKNLDSVVSTLNMSLVNKGFNVWKGCVLSFCVYCAGG